MLPSILAEQLKEGIKDYIETTFPMTNIPFKGSIKNFLETNDAIYHEPYISVKLPFRVANEMPTHFKVIKPSYLPYVHQKIAFERLKENDSKSTLIATGTGSGKTECFLYPILEYCYKHKEEKGIKALIIYPMNALATDQSRRIAKLIYNNESLKNNVTAGMYIGGQEEVSSRMMTETSIITDHESMLNNAPDILITNYKMLDYLLVRFKDSSLWQYNKKDTLKYIVVDELHTFDGAQGTDLACLLRRLKYRLEIPKDYVCCIGTSATMGSKDENEKIITYASKIFGEPFDKDAVVTEDRLSPEEFFKDIEITDFTIPTVKQVNDLEELIKQDDEEKYLNLALKSWTTLKDIDIKSSNGKLALSKHLMNHSFMRAMITLTKGNFYQIKTIAEELSVNYPEFKNVEYAKTAINALLSLISYARIGTIEHLRPFLNVQVQLWLRELRRLLARVSNEEVQYSIAHDLNAKQMKQYLPVINCRDCGGTGYASLVNEHGNASLKSLELFYNLFFRGDGKIAFIYPYNDDFKNSDMIMGHICPNCLQIKLGDSKEEDCDKCGYKMIKVAIPTLYSVGNENHKQFICPCCGSKKGLSLIGLRSSTEISAELTQIFTSKFNDDKKALAFCDSVQDAAHHAGFFNARTWRFGFRSALQNYIQNGGAGQNLNDFSKGFIEYSHKKMNDEEFVGFFIAPNMTWKKAYEDLIQKRKFTNTFEAKQLIQDIEKRISYEIMLEYGIASKIGRTLEKTGCSCIEFSNDDISNVAKNVRERYINELGGQQTLSVDIFKQMVAGYLRIMAQNGAFNDRVFDTFIKEGGKDYLLTNKHIKWMPGMQSGRNVPRFIYDLKDFRKKYSNFDLSYDKKYLHWISNCINELFEDSEETKWICKTILDELKNNGVVKKLQLNNDYDIYALNKDRIVITDKVTFLKCDSCQTIYPVSSNNKKFWIGAPCVRLTCKGEFKESDETSTNYYGKLFTTGDTVRINTREHTGLLERKEREALEIDFKRDKDSRKVWDPNVLSCTPTLEMGIDIGDLSSVVLCGIPPEQSKFLQRIGRSGRKDGNSFTLVVASVRPHDLYFYSDPFDMISGKIVPPMIFMQASAVLERQFVAFCMDTWVKYEASASSIPSNVKTVLNNLKKPESGIFPFNFLKYIQYNLKDLFENFIKIFGDDLDEVDRNELYTFANGNELKESPMHIRILEAFDALKKQKDSLYESVKHLKTLINELKNKPKDSSYDEEINELSKERAALVNVINEICKKDIFNFLSDEGLLPNYAFPESGIILKAVLYRKEENEENYANNQNQYKKRKYKNLVYEYNRAASAAISEFAPQNSFYVAGRKLKIDQIDLISAKSANWRLCPNCSHIQLEETGKNVDCCPQCESRAFSDIGQVRKMLKVQMVYSNMDYSSNLISDESDDRSNVFYCKQLLVDVDENNDILSAYSMDNDEFTFGYEFVKKATLREINFGENDANGEKLTVAGIEDVRKGFKVCKYCGKIQTDTKDGKGTHMAYCKTRKSSAMLDDPYEECLFIYREFSTEALRILIPSTTMDMTEVRAESFIAAFMLGMKEYFGNVDHLRATLCEVPVKESSFRKKYLVIFDSVPGGTGYLKQLMNNKGSLIEIFEKALQKLKTCSCKDDPQKDGCYHCLYAYRQSKNMGNISRSTAIKILEKILSGKDSLTKIDKLGSISVNPLFDSELEMQFIAALPSMANDKRKIEVTKALVNDKEGYVLKIKDNVNDKEISWEIEPQVFLNKTSNVSVPCRPDFIIRPIGDTNNKLPVAVFVDGFHYHYDKVSDDTLKRESLRKSGKYYVWTLSWYDIHAVFEEQKDYYTQTLDYSYMPSGNKMFKDYIKNFIKAESDVLQPYNDSVSTYELLMRYLTLDNSEEIFKVYANAYSWSLLKLGFKNENDFNNWYNVVEKIDMQTRLIPEKFVREDTTFEIWNPREEDSLLSIYSGLRLSSYKQDKNTPVSIYAVLNDDVDISITDEKIIYEKEWNGFWHFYNMMQFSKDFVAVTKKGLTSNIYDMLTNENEETLYENNESSNIVDNKWQAILNDIYDEETKRIVDVLINKGISAPDNAGDEIVNESNEVVAEVELIWNNKKICYMTESQRENIHKAIAQGFKVFTNVDEIDGVFKEK